MRRLVPVVIRPWMLPLIVAALALPIIAGFALVGPQLGLALGAIAVAVVLAVAARLQFDEPIEVAESVDARFRLLVVAGEAVDEPRTIARLAEIAGAGSAALGREGPPLVRVLAPARLRTLDRWATDLAEARETAARALAVSVAALAAGGLEASGSVGDADPVQAITDELITFPAQEVALVAGPALGVAEADEVRRRLDRPVSLIAEGPPPSPGAPAG